MRSHWGSQRSARVDSAALPAAETRSELGTLGAVPIADGRTRFAVWAPAADSVAVRVRQEDHVLAARDGGMWEGEPAVSAGADYLYVLAGEHAAADPCSRFQPEGIRGPSRIVDLSSFSWTDQGWQGVPLDELVIYELHVGTFSAEGTFDGVIPYLAGLRDLGVTAIELMPVATFPGSRGWGYDGVYTYAPHPTYGGPEGLARLVDAAHATGLGVLLDVVYNHIGPGSGAIAAFGPYFTDRNPTFWGPAMNYDGEGAKGVREWAIQNACMWVRDYHVDGLRLDATHAVFDESPRHVLAELADRVRAERASFGTYPAQTRDTFPATSTPGFAGPPTQGRGVALVTSEMGGEDLRPIEEWGHDAQWADGLHHEVHVLLTGERDGYYAGFGSGAGLVRHLGRRPAERLIVCSQNHDQVGNRALGDRPVADELRIRAMVTLFAPQTPLIFMGEEYGERHPFQFFTDHIDPAIAEATRQGRRTEFSAFTAFSGEELPDPQDPETFERSRLSHEGDPILTELYRELLALRRELPRESEASWDEATRTLTVRRGDVTLVADFARKTAELRR
jgi:maltooligosyltrehalose trehalohydrolase